MFSSDMTHGIRIPGRYTHLDQERHRRRVPIGDRWSASQSNCRRSSATAERRPRVPFNIIRLRGPVRERLFNRRRPSRSDQSLPDRACDRRWVRGEAGTKNGETSGTKAANKPSRRFWKTEKKLKPKQLARTAAADKLSSAWAVRGRECE